MEVPRVPPVVVQVGAVGDEGRVVEEFGGGGEVVEVEGVGEGLDELGSFVLISEWRMFPKFVWLD